MSDYDVIVIGTGAGGDHLLERMGARQSQPEAAHA